MAESVCRKCGKPIQKVGDKWQHTSSGGSRGTEIFEQEHHASPGKK